MSFETEIVGFSDVFAIIFAPEDWIAGVTFVPPIVKLTTEVKNRIDS